MNAHYFCYRFLPNVYTLITLQVKIDVSLTFQLPHSFWRLISTEASSFFGSRGIPSTKHGHSCKLLSTYRLIFFRNQFRSNILSLPYKRACQKSRQLPKFQRYQLSICGINSHFPSLGHDMVRLESCTSRSQISCKMQLSGLSRH
jgi:hypothetical protein